MPRDKVGIGIVGGGKAGRNFALAIRSCQDADAIAFCSRRPSSAEEAAQVCGVPKWTTDYGEMLQDADVDAVIVASPDEHHCEHTVLAAQAGKHVLCEKPMCRSLEEADRMMGEAEENDVILMVGFLERYSHPCTEVKRRIDSGDIGTPRMVLARRCHPSSVVRGREWLNDDQTGGVLNYAGTHNIDLICWFMGSAPERVYGEMGQLILTGQDFTDCAVMTSGYEVVDSVTWPAGEKGIEGALLAEVAHFVDCVTHGKTLLTTGEDGKLAIKIAIAAREAAETGKAVRI